jgi:hypothetical protein
MNSSIPFDEPPHGDEGDGLKVIGPSIPYHDAKLSTVHSASYAFDSRLCSSDDTPPSLKNSPQLKIIKAHEENKHLEHSRGRSKRRLFGGGKKSDYYSTYHAPRLSPSSKRKHKKFWNQMDDGDDSITDVDTTDDDIELPFDEASEKTASKRASIVQKKGRTKRIVKNDNSCHYDFFSFISCGWLGGDSDSVMYEEYAQKEVTINPVATVYDYNH